MFDSARESRPHIPDKSNGEHAAITWDKQNTVTVIVITLINLFILNPQFATHEEWTSLRLRVAIPLWPNVNE